MDKTKAGNDEEELICLPIPGVNQMRLVYSKPKTGYCGELVVIGDKISVLERMAAHLQTWVAEQKRQALLEGRLN